MQHSIVGVAAKITMLDICLMVAKNSTFDCTAISRRNSKSQLAMTCRAAIDARQIFLASAEGNHAAQSSGRCIRTASTAEPALWPYCRPAYGTATLLVAGNSAFATVTSAP